MSHRVESEQRNYFTSVQSQLSATVVEPLSSMGQTYSENAKSGVSPSLNAVDTGMKAAMTLSGLGDAVFSSLAIPALGVLGLKGMACLPISKQLDPVMGVDAHIMVPPGSPVPAPYIGILIYPKDFLAIAIASVIPPPLCPKRVKVLRVRQTRQRRVRLSIPWQQWLSVCSVPPSRLVISFREPLRAPPHGAFPISATSSLRP